MTYRMIDLPIRRDDGTLSSRQIEAETVAGMIVHRDHAGRGWVVSTKNGLAVYGAPRYTTRRLKTRAQAREVARYLSPFMPNLVLRGEWDGNGWTKHSPATAESFHAAVRALNIKLSGF